MSKATAVAYSKETSSHLIARTVENCEKRKKQ
jgi:hypothetical protein